MSIEHRYLTIADKERARERETEQRTKQLVSDVLFDDTVRAMKRDAFLASPLFLAFSVSADSIDRE